MSQVPNPVDDWLDQRELAELLGVTQKTASCWAKAGKLAAYQHGVPHCGRRKYSRKLVERKLTTCWQAAIKRQDANRDAPEA